MVSKSKNINDNIKKLRKKKGYTQAQVAEMLGMKTSTYSQMERLGNVPAQLVLRLADVFGVDPMQIMDPDNEGLINVSFGGKGDAVVKQPPINFDPKPEREEFILSNREKNSIIMLRNMKSADREELYAEIKKRHDKRNKRGK